jgi:molybdopterin/thiamine biosynthesis adenylyltransferase
MLSPCFRSLAEVDLDSVVTFLQNKSNDGLLPFSIQDEAATRYSLSLAEIEEISLAQGILPARYQRNQEMISTRQQLTLFRSKVAVIGCGGLGGYIIEELARLGVGNIIAVDPDVFAEHNLNRQLFCTLDQLGKKKVAAAAQRVKEINPAVNLQQKAEEFGNENGQRLLQGVDVAADALDSIPARLNLSRTCKASGIPLVHGAIAGWYGHVATQYPGEDILEHIYSQHEEKKGIETRLGNPSFTPALVASLEVAEIIKILLQTGELLRGKYLHIDLYHLEANEIHFENN